MQGWQLAALVGGGEPSPLPTPTAKNEKPKTVFRRGTEEAVTGSTRNRLGGSSLPRGFESHPLRHIKQGEKGKRVKGEKGRASLGFLTVAARRARPWD